MKRFLAFTLSTSILFSSVIAAPKFTKSESVFVNLDYYGDAEEINVYNTFSIFGDTEISDFGEYTSITNLTNKAEYTLTDNNKKVWNVNGLSNFSYIGKMDNEKYKNVPWNFDVKYKLNGVLINPTELLHKSGTVEINVDINANKDALEYYKNNYMLEITGTYDMSDFLSVESDEAMFISKGNTKTLMFIVLPGQSTDFTLRIGSNDFEMDGLTFAMVPLEGDMLDEVSEIVENKEDLEDALEEINKSTDSVLYAMSDMASGMREMKDGIATLQNGTDKIHETDSNRDESITNLKNTLVNLKENIKDGKSDLTNLSDLIDKTFNLLKDANMCTDYIINDLSHIRSDLNDISEIIEDLPEDLEDLSDAIDNMSDLTNALSTLLSEQNSAADIDIDELTTSMTNIGAALYGINAELTSIDGITEPAALSKLSSIGTKVATVGENFNKVKNDLEEVSGTLDSVEKTKSSTIKKLKNLANDLNDVSDKIEPDDGEVVINSVDNISSLMKDLKETLEVVRDDVDGILDNKNKTLNSIDNLKDTLNKAEDLIDATNNLIDVIEDTLDILSNEIYEGGDKTANGILDITDQMITITDEADQFIYSKNKAKDAVKKEWDKLEDKTNLLKVDANMKPVSFSSDKNDAPEKVQFLLKLPDICERKVSNEDLEVEVDNGTFWSRLLAILEKMFGWILKLFKK